MRFIQKLLGIKEKHTPVISQTIQTTDAELLEKANHIINPILGEISEEHWKVLYRKKQQLTIKDDYGDINNEKWTEESKKYTYKYIIPKIQWHDIFTLSQYFDRLASVGNLTFDYKAFLIIHGFIENILDTNREILSSKIIENRPSDPYEYEEFCANILRKNGWNACTTKSSGDQGADIKAEKDGVTIVIQCKLYSKPVGNKAIQEICAALKFYHADYGIVTTNNSFTYSAKALANSNNILLLHDSQLSEITPQSLLDDLRN